MASAFSSHAVSRGHTGNHDDHLPHSPRVNHDGYFAHDTPNPCATIHLIPRLTVKTLNPCIVPFHGTAADGADASMEQPRRSRMTSSSKFRRGVLILLFGLCATGLIGQNRAAAEGTAASIPVEMVADYLYALIEADREAYTKHVVERLQSKGVVVASENWEATNSLPLPAQLLMESGRIMGRKNTGVQYRLISLWPINKRNAASSEIEKLGLATILTHPAKPYTGYVKEGGTRYFRAVYPDLAVTQACIGCHNAHPDSPKRDFKINDVMGGLVISIPVK